MHSKFSLSYGRGISFIYSLRICMVFCVLWPMGMYGIFKQLMLLVGLVTITMLTVNRTYFLLFDLIFHIISIKITLLILVKILSSFIMRVSFRNKHLIHLN